ncbi:HU family DNA-binding protein [uncultured Parabacteroides sp.]|uniref:HU family DNA-binding protein n=1 Tax=uncultured Parabacteroides sp. TaxID=512312 RepID=UPI00259B7893|nr:HU family DNA-binding protein [uncultured Parabacteroides sp.]
MNKIELAKEIASRMSVTVTETLRFIDTMNEVITDSIIHDESVIIQNFGHYMIWNQSERMGRNPRTGQECAIPKRMSVKFKPGKGLIDKINGK